MFCESCFVTVFSERFEVGFCVNMFCFKTMSLMLMSAACLPYYNSYQNDLIQRYLWRRQVKNKSKRKPLTPSQPSQPKQYVQRLEQQTQPKKITSVNDQRLYRIKF